MKLLPQCQLQENDSETVDFPRVERVDIHLKHLVKKKGWNYADPQFSVSLY